MIPLRDPQHERACQHLAGGFSLTPEERARRGITEGASLQEEAAALGGLDPKASSFKANARKFCQRKIIRERVADLQFEGAALASTSVGSLLVEADAARVGAMTKKDFSAANSCIQTKMHLIGAGRKSVVELQGRIGTYDLSKCSDDELNRLESILGPLAFAGRDQGREEQALG
jgi:hypothetical protein